MQTEKRDEIRWARGGVCLLAIALAVSTAGCSFFESGGGSSGSGSGDRGAQKKSGSTGGGGGKKQAGEAEKGDSKKEEAANSGSSEESGESESSGAGSEVGSGSGGADSPLQTGDRRRNPFAAAPEFRNQEESETDETEPSTQPRGPLRRYSYEKYRLAGLISETAIPKAMFIAPDQVGHLVKPGDRIGKEGGVVQDIRENAVEVELPPQGEEGRSRKVTVELRQAELPDEQQQQGLTEEEQETLQRLLESEEGRKAVRNTYQNRAGRGGGQQQQNEESGFDGLEPPE